MIRFWNNDVMGNPDAVIAVIQRVIEERKKAPL